MQLAVNPSAAVNLQPTPPLTPVDETDRIPPIWSAQFDGPSECSLALEYRRDRDGRLIKYGDGAFSNVYSAISVDHVSPPRTPPRRPKSPTDDSDTPIYAIKVASGKEAHAIISAEAEILTQLHRVARSTQHIVPFHGFIPSLHAIVMTAVPLSLADYLQIRAGEAAASFSTRTMLKPVVGTATWLSLAEGLVRGLRWLHDDAGVVHGDIKPQNILLRPRIDDLDGEVKRSPGINDTVVDAFDVLFVDFTSSYRLDSTTPLGTGLSAVSPPFTAPEVLSMMSMGPASSSAAPVLPKPSSDIFSLAVTMLAVATGSVSLYPGTSSMRRLAMTREGHRVLEHVRSTEQASRVPRKGVVERVVSPAVLKDAEMRPTADQWLQLVVAEVAAFAS